MSLVQLSSYLEHIHLLKIIEMQVHFRNISVPCSLSCKCPLFAVGLCKCQERHVLSPVVPRMQKPHRFTDSISNAIKLKFDKTIYILDMFVFKLSLLTK